MRDPSRILVFCDRLAKAWQQFPDLRFGQFILNIFYEDGRDLFYTEDDEMIEIIEKWAKNSKGENNIF